MKSSCFRPSLTVLASLLSISVYAQAPIASLDQVVVTASRAAQLEQDVVGDVTVITHEEIARAGQNSLAEILARQPGIEFSNNGGPQTVTGVSIRGAETRHTLVLINGMRINSSVQGVVNFNAIDPASVQRIEIIRGAASSLYGSAAIGGVINIITIPEASNQPAQFYGSVGVGSQHTVKSNLGIDGAQDGFSYNLNASVADSHGFNATNKDNPFSYYGDKDGYRSHAFNGSLAYEWAQHQSIGVNAYNSYIKGDFDAGDFYPDAFTQTRQQSYDVFSRNRIHTNWLSTLSMGLSKEQVSNPSYDSRYSSLQRLYRWQNDITLTEQQQVALYVERLEERVTHTTQYSDTKRNTNSVGAIYRLHTGPHHLQASLRNDKISAMSSHSTGSLGYDIDLSNEWSIGAAASTGFKAPSFTDLYYPLEWGFKGNPNLKPEKSRNLEAHVGFDNGTSQFKLTAFQNKVRDLIDGYVCNDYFECTSMNVDRATIRGVSIYGAHDFGSVNLWASADLINPRDDSTKNQLAHRAKQNVKLGAQYQWHALNVGAEYQYVSKRFDDIANTESKRLGSYSLVNLTADYQFTKTMSAQVRWNNIFDKTYYSTYGYNMPGSNVFVNVSWRM